MVCGNRFCIYWEADACVLEEIELDSLGACQSCVYVELGEDLLQERRQRARSRDEGEPTLAK